MSFPLLDIVAGLGLFRTEDKAETGRGRRVEEWGRQGPAGLPLLWMGTLPLCRVDRAPLEALVSGLESQKQICQPQEVIWV